LCHKRHVYSSKCTKAFGGQAPLEVAVGVHSDPKPLSGYRVWGSRRERKRGKEVREKEGMEGKGGNEKERHPIFLQKDRRH